MIDTKSLVAGLLTTATLTGVMTPAGAVAAQRDDAAAEAAQRTFVNPVITSQDAPDPWVIFKDGYYYFTATLDPISVWRSRTLTGLDQAKKVQVWTPPSSGPQSRQIWAPELHFLQGKWYLYYTASDGVDHNHRHYVLEAKTDDPLGEYEDKGRVDPDHDAYSIDGSVLEMPDGKLYWMYTTGALEIAPMVNPTKVDGSKRVRLAEPTFPWERGWIEAPQALVRDGRLFIVYSAGHSGTPHYSLGMLTHKGGDVLDPKNWEKAPFAVFHPYFGADGAVYNVGHNSFTKSPDGSEDWIVYHGKDWADHRQEGFKGRTCRVQRFTWNGDGTPNFGHPIPSGTLLPVPSGE